MNNIGKRLRVRTREERMLLVLVVAVSVSVELEWLGVLVLMPLETTWCSVDLNTYFERLSGIHFSFFSSFSCYFFLSIFNLKTFAMA